MSAIYRKSLKGIDELAFKSTGLPMRLASYLLAVDGVHSADQLATQNPQLPSMAMVLRGLLEQGFLEVAEEGAAPNALRLSEPPANRAPQQPAAQTLPRSDHGLASLRDAMARDVATIMGSDSAPVVQKIQNCKTRDDLFATLMGLKKIITIYRDSETAEKFYNRYQSLSG